MESWTIPARFSTPAERESALAVLRSEQLPDAPAIAAAAWHVRQSDWREADAAIRRLGTSIHDASSPWALYSTLVRAEQAGLCGHAEEALQLATAAALHAERIACFPGLSDAYWTLAVLASDRGHPIERDGHMRASLEAAKCAGDEPRELAARLALACFDTLWDGQQALQDHEAWVTPWLECEDQGTCSLANSFMFHAFWSVGRYAEAIERGLLAQRCAETAGQYRRVLMDGSGVAAILSDLGDLDGALDRLQGLLAWAQACGWEPAIGACMATTSNVLLKLGQLDAARDFAEAALLHFGADHTSANALGALLASADALHALGDMGLAKQRYRQLVSVDTCSELASLPRYGWLGLARIALAEHDTSGAHEAATKALASAEASLDPFASADALRLMARASASQGSAARTQVDCLDRAVSIQRTMGMEHPDAGLLAELADALEASGNSERALVVLRESMVSASAQRAMETTKRGVAMEVRFRTEQATREAELEREAAAREKKRADELAQAMAELRTAQLQLARKNEELVAAYNEIEQLSLRDPLTGLHNRRFFAQVIDSAIAECLRAHASPGAPEIAGARAPSGRDLVFLLLDIDHFKQVNDQFGHPAGDALLVQLKDRLLKVLRAQDYFFRWGGEEFLVVARGLPRSDAAVVAERLRAAVASAPFVLPDGQPLAKTVSIGFSALATGVDDPNRGRWERAIEVADQNLYTAKGTGRNRCVGESATYLDNLRYSE